MKWKCFRSRNGAKARGHNLVGYYWRVVDVHNATSPMMRAMFPEGFLLEAWLGPEFGPFYLTNRGGLEFAPDAGRRNDPIYWDNPAFVYGGPGETI